MFHATIRKSGGRFEAVIPDDVVERLGLIEGQEVAIRVTPIEPERAVREEITNILDKTAERSAPVMQYLKDK
jgi:antitoxin component of MazEF toxin-antitoxin module